MKGIGRSLAIIVVMAALLNGCALKEYAGPGTDVSARYRPMPDLPQQLPSNEPVPVFGTASEFQGSPLAEVGHQALFAVHPAESTEIAILPNGDVSFAARMQMLEAAHTSIRIQALIFAGDESGLKIAEVLKRKKAAGLDVRVIVDAVSNLDLQTQWMYFDLKQHGIEVQGYESLYLQWLNEIPLPPLLASLRDPEAPNHRYHEKMWIIDGETADRRAVAGGLNIANEYFRITPNDPDGNWRDQDIVVRGAPVADMVTAFERNFAHFLQIKESRGIFNTDLYWEATRNALDILGKLDIPYQTDAERVARVNDLAMTQPDLHYVKARSRFFHNRPRLGETYLPQAYAKLFAHARQEILICNAYFIPAQEVIDAIRNAVNRGLHVRILTNSPETNDLPEMSMVGRSYYSEILALNNTDEARQSGGQVQLWEWHGKRFGRTKQTQGTIHAKYAVFDRQYALVGSYNLDPRSEKLNSETAVVFESETLASELARLFYENDLAYSRLVTPREAAEFKDPTDAIYKLRKEFGDIFAPLL